MADEEGDYVSMGSNHCRTPAVTNEALLSATIDDGSVKPYIDDVATSLLDVLYSITVVISDYLTRQSVPAEDCLVIIKGYLVEMIKSWNGTNLHQNITSIVNSFDNKKDYRYLSLRPSNIDSGCGTCGSTSSLPRRSREHPLAREAPKIPPRSKESLSSESHKFSLQEFHADHPSTVIRRNTVTTVLPKGGLEYQNNPPNVRVRRNQPMAPRPKRSFVLPAVSMSSRRTSAPVNLLSSSNQSIRLENSEVNLQSGLVEGSDAVTSRSHIRHRSRSTVRRPFHLPPLPRRRFSDSSSTAVASRSLNFSPTLDELGEDDEDEEDGYSRIGAVEYIVPKRHTDDKCKANCNVVDSRPNIDALRTKLWKRNSTMKRKRRPAFQKRSLTHSDDASSDDSDAKSSKPRRVSSYHPTYKVSGNPNSVRRRRTAHSFSYGTTAVIPPSENIEEEFNVNGNDSDPSGILDHSVKNHSSVPAESDGDNEASEWLANSKSTEHRLVELTAPLVSPAVKAIKQSELESDTSDSDQEIFYPYCSTRVRVYATADIGLLPQESYNRLMGSCTKQEDIAKAGNLLRFSNGRKHWSKCWLEIRGTLLLCYKSKLHINRRPKISFKLNMWCKLSCIKDEKNCFEIETATSSCRLKASSQFDMDNWLVVLRKVLISAESPYINARRSSSIYRPNEMISSYLYLIEFGLLCYRWASLEGKSLHFHTNQTAAPYTKVDLNHVSLSRIKKLPKMTGGEVSGKIEELIQHEEDLLIIQITNANSADRFIVLEGMDNQLAWQHHFLLQCRQITGLHLTDTEKLICQLIGANEPYSSTLWNHPTLMSNAASITSPLTSLPCEDAKQTALKLNETVLLYCSTDMMSTALEYHIVSVQNLIQKCLQQPSIQNEFYCQVIRQTQSVNDPVSRKVMKAWQLLSFIIPIFLPKQSFLSYLEAHLLRHMTTSKHSVIVDASSYCKRLITRSDQNGLRENIASKFELSSLMSSLLIKSTIAEPLSITVVFTDPTEEEMRIEFDPCSLIHEILVKVRDQKKCSPNSDFTLTVNWFDKSSHEQNVAIEKFLYPIQKVCDVISQWSDAMQSLPSDGGRRLNHPVFTFKQRLFFKKKKTKLTNREIILLSHQFQQDVVQNRFPATRETYIKLTGLMAQMMCGDLKNHTDDSDDTIMRLSLQYLPSKITIHRLQHNSNVMCVELREQWKRLDQYAPLQCAMKHLEIGWEWPHFGSKLFHTQSLHTGAHVWLAVGEDGISVLSDDLMHTILVYSYNNILSFGQQDHCFKLVVTQSNTVYYAETLLYVMSQLMIEEINGLTASYLEYFLQAESDESEA